MAHIVPSRHWDFEDEVDPIKGPKGDTAFLRDNYKLMTTGSIFRTPAARFTHAQIHAGAKKAGFVVEINQEGPWLRVKVVGKLPKEPVAAKKQTEYFGAGKVYPDILS
jgi:hypothetical protein